MSNTYLKVKGFRTVQFFFCYFMIHIYFLKIVSLHKKELYELIQKRSEEDGNVNEYRMPDAYDQEGGVNQEK
ncbi:unnamed protein product [Trifolium pratense]|uniref:Uncharacterized protein n=1 Tax=Trifolium pratense TaxID=57577 RepID=A0ACB0IVE1_TRIPR|nr:unnamed protein product [Trifolium pratense]